MAESGTAPQVQDGVAAAEGQLPDEQFAPVPEGVGALVVATGLAAIGLAAMGLAAMGLAAMAVNGPGDAS